MHVGMGLVRDGQADAYVTAGNTGGVLAVATLHTLRRIRGVKRPAMAAILPMPAGHFAALDIGANADCRPEYLRQFAVMGDTYARAVLGCARPRVALLSNGEEPGKGNTLVKEASRLTGVKEKTALVRMGLESLVARASSKRLAALGGTEPALRPTRRRRA